VKASTSRRVRGLNVRGPRSAIAAVASKDFYAPRSSRVNVCCNVHRSHDMSVRCDASGSPTAPIATFDVASVKINRSGLPGGFSEIHPGGRFTETNQTLRQIILDAYGMESFRVTGGPSWIGTDRFDLDGRAARDVPREDTRRGATGGHRTARWPTRSRRSRCSGDLHGDTGATRTETPTDHRACRGPLD
jgi:hypothetical protein